MKLHLPTGLRKALLACLAALAGRRVLRRTMASGTALLGAFSVLWSTAPPSQANEESSLTAPAGDEFALGTESEGDDDGIRIIAEVPENITFTVDRGGDQNQGSSDTHLGSLLYGLAHYNQESDVWNVDLAETTNQTYFVNDATVHAQLYLNKTLVINNGSSLTNNRTTVITFAGAITGADGANLVYGWTNQQTWVFQNVLSGFEGDILTQGRGGSNTGQVFTCIIEGTSSTGEISLSGPNDVLELHNATMQNSAISVTTLNVTNGTTTFGVNGNVTVTGTLTIAAGSKATFNSGTISLANITNSGELEFTGSNATIGGQISNSGMPDVRVSLTGGVLTLENTVTIAEGKSLKLSVSGEGKLKMDVEALTSLANQNIVLDLREIEGSSYSYQLFDLQEAAQEDWINAAEAFLEHIITVRHNDDLSVSSTGLVTFTCDSSAHELNWSDSVTTWEVGGDEAVWTDTTAGDAQTSTFYNGDNVFFADGENVHTIAISGTVAPGSITVNSGKFSFTDGTVNADSLSLANGSQVTFKNTAITLSGTGAQAAASSASSYATLTLTGTSQLNFYYDAADGTGDMLKNVVIAGDHANLYFRDQNASGLESPAIFTIRGLNATGGEIKGNSSTLVIETQVGDEFTSGVLFKDYAAQARKKLALMKKGEGKQIFSASDLDTASTTVEGGILEFTAGTVSTWAAFTVNNGGQAIFDHNATFVESGNIEVSGSGSTLSFGGNLTGLGVTIRESGTMTVDGNASVSSLALESGSVTIKGEVSSIGTCTVTSGTLEIGADSKTSGDDGLVTMTYEQAWAQKCYATGGHTTAVGNGATINIYGSAIAHAEHNFTVDGTLNVYGALLGTWICAGNLTVNSTGNCVVGLGYQNDISDTGKGSVDDVGNRTGSANGTANDAWLSGLFVHGGSATIHGNLVLGSTAENVFVVDGGGNLRIGGSIYYTGDRTQYNKNVRAGDLVIGNETTGGTVSVGGLAVVKSITLFDGSSFLSTGGVDVESISMGTGTSVTISGTSNVGGSISIASGATATLSGSLSVGTGITANGNLSIGGAATVNGAQTWTIGAGGKLEMTTAGASLAMANGGSLEIVVNTDGEGGKLKLSGGVMQSLAAVSGVKLMLGDFAPTQSWDYALFDINANGWSTGDALSMLTHLLGADYTGLENNLSVDTAGTVYYEMETEPRELTWNGSGGGGTWSNATNPSYADNKPWTVDGAEAGFSSYDSASFVGGRGEGAIIVDGHILVGSMNVSGGTAWSFRGDNVEEDTLLLRSGLHLTQLGTTVGFGDSLTLSLADITFENGTSGDGSSAVAFSGTHVTLSSSQSGISGAGTVTLSEASTLTWDATSDLVIGDGSTATTLTIGGSTTVGQSAARAGDLQIKEGSTVTLKSTGAVYTGAVQVEGNLVLDGTGAVNVNGGITVGENGVVEFKRTSSLTGCAVSGSGTLKVNTATAFNEGSFNALVGGNLGSFVIADGTGVLIGSSTGHKVNYVSEYRVEAGGALTFDAPVVNFPNITVHIAGQGRQLLGEESSVEAVTSSYAALGLYNYSGWGDDGDRHTICTFKVVLDGDASLGVGNNASGTSAIYVEMQGSIDFAGHTLAKVGYGELRLNGAFSASGDSGVINVENGQITLAYTQNATALQNIDVNLCGSTLDQTPVSGALKVDESASIGALYGSGTVTIAAEKTLTLNKSNDETAHPFAGSITGTGALVLSDGVTFAVNGTEASISSALTGTGTLKLTGGTLTLGTGFNVGGTTPQITVDNGATLVLGYTSSASTSYWSNTVLEVNGRLLLATADNVDNATYTVGGLSGALNSGDSNSYRVQTSQTSGNAKLIVNYNGLDEISFSGEFRDNIAGGHCKFDFVKQGSGTQIFTTGQFDTKSTTVEAGTLKFANAGTTWSTFTVQSGGAAIFANGWTFNGSSLTVNGGTVEVTAGNLSVGSALTMTGGSITTSGTGTVSASTLTQSAGSINVAGGLNVTADTGVYTMTGGSAEIGGKLGLNDTGNGEKLVISGNGSVTAQQVRGMRNTGHAGRITVGTVDEGGNVSAGTLIVTGTEGDVLMSKGILVQGSGSLVTAAGSANFYNTCSDGTNSLHVDAGRVEITGGVTITGGHVLVENAGRLTVTEQTNMSGKNLSVNNGTVALSGGLTAASVALSQGSLTLGGTVNVSGNFTVNDGTVDASGASLTASAITMQQGSLALGGALNVANGVTASGGTVKLGASSVAANLTISLSGSAIHEMKEGTLTQGAEGVRLTLDIDATDNTAGGKLRLTNTVMSAWLDSKEWISITGTRFTGARWDYQLFDLTDLGDAWTAETAKDFLWGLLGLQEGKMTVDPNGTVHYARGSVLTWNGAGDGLWNTSSGNWESGSAYADGDSVTFGSGGSEHSSVTVVGALTPGDIRVTDRSAYTFTGQDNAASIEASGNLYVDAGSSASFSNLTSFSVVGGAVAGNLTLESTVTGTKSLGHMTVESDGKVTITDGDVTNWSRTTLSGGGGYGVAECG